MAGTTIWKGYIRFGDTDIAVKLHSAVREERIGFHLLHSRDQARLRQQMICALEKKPVSPQEQAHGFEVEEGKYVIMSPEELDRMVPESSRVIDVHEFVKNDRLDSLFVERSYYLEPDPAGARGKAYGGLVRALRELDVAGICTWTMRKRAYLGALRAGEKVLRLSTLRYADEVIAASSLGLREVPVSERELNIGSELIRQLSGAFEPGKFADEHQAKLRELIEKKARGERIAVVEPRRLQPTEPDELLKVLEASLKKAA